MGTLEEDFIFDDGEIDRRVWTLNPLDQGRYSGIADDVLINESRMSKFDIPVGEFLLVIEKTNHKFFTQSSIQHYLCEISTTY